MRRPVHCSICSRQLKPFASTGEPRPYPLEGVNDALEAIKARPGGFVNIVVNPDR